MQKQISIPHTLSIDQRQVVVLLFYTIDRIEKALTIQCYVEAAYPNDIGWLGLKRFQLRAVETGNKTYELLYDEQLAAYNLDTNLFAEQAFEVIMKKEKLKSRAGVLV